MKYRKGDRVLVERVIAKRLDLEGREGYLVGDESDCAIDGPHAWADHVHPYVDIEALEEEVELLWDANRYECGDHGARRLNELRDARLAANKPKEVWVRGTVFNEKNMDGNVVVDITQDFGKTKITPSRLVIHPDDIEER